MTKVLSKKDQERRELILNGNMWRVILYIATPLAVFQWLQQFFRIFDTVIAAQISPMSVSAVAYLSQISGIISALGAGISVGSCIKIGEAYGAGEYETVHKMVNSLMKVCGQVSFVVLICIPFSSSFLKVLGTPDDFILEGTIYFAIILLDCAINFYNTSYIAIERIRGHSGLIFGLNLSAFFVKLGLSMLFVFVFNGGVHMIALATVISDMVIFTAFVINLCIKDKDGIFAVKMIRVRHDKNIFKSMANMSTPVIIEKVLFQYGKYLMTVMASGYGSLVSGALGISNNIGGMTVSLSGGFQDAGSAIISQNVGAGKKRRSLDAFYKLCVINTLIGVIGFILASTFMAEIASIFDGGDPEFSQLIQDIYFWEVYALVPQAFFGAVCALLYGNGYTRMSMVLNLVRLFVLRVPVLWLFQAFTDVGYQATGIAMCTSNGGIGIIGGIASIFVVRRIKKDIAIEEAMEKEEQLEILEEENE
ncbi:MAG: MATE family efflux transporter [Clostridia bacterium]